MVRLGENVGSLENNSANLFLFNRYINENNLGKYLINAEVEIQQNKSKMCKGKRHLNLTWLLHVDLINICTYVVFSHYLRGICSINAFKLLIFCGTERNLYCSPF